MALGAKLFLRQSQSLVMTPQLMQSIQLLQMPHAELTAFIAQEVEKNPLLEMGGEESHGDERPEAAEPAAHESGEPASDWYREDRQPSETIQESLDSNYDSAFSEDAPTPRPDAPELMSQWKSMPGSGGDDHVDLDEFVASRPCLRDHLTDQIALTFRDARAQAIARHMIDYLDDAGYFRGEPSEIAGNIGIGTMLYVKLHVKHGSVIFEGDPSVVGGPFVMGPGNRMVWDERKRAFRVGGITGSQWDDVNVGDYSTVSGGVSYTANNDNQHRP